MSETPFHQTRMGQRFYESTVPTIARELVRLNDNLERLLAVVAGDAKVAKPDPPRSDDGEREEPR